VRHDAKTLFAVFTTPYHAVYCDAAEIAAACLTSATLPMSAISAEQFFAARATCRDWLD